MSAEGEGMSKSARKRANKKARESGEAEAEEPAPPPAPAPKAKAQTAPKAEAKAKAKAEAKAEAKAAAAPEPKAKGKAKAAPAPEPKAEPKAKAKGEAKAKAKAEAAPPPEPQTSAAAKPKAKGKAKPKKQEEEEEAPVAARKKSQDDEWIGRYQVDDGKGGDWEVSTGLSKKAQQRKDRLDEEKKRADEEARALKAQGIKGGVLQAKAGQYIPGLTPVEAAPSKGAKAKAAPVTAAFVGVSKAAVAEKEGEKVAAPSDNSVSASVPVPQEKIGRVIGPKGSNIALIKEKTGVKTVDTADGLVTIVGSKDAVTLAEAAVRELIEKGYMSLAFENFKNEEVAVPPLSIANIVGEKGAIIQVIKKECNCEVNIPPTPKNMPAGKKVRISVAGTGAGVDKAKDIITSIATFGYHAITHPGFTHQEMEVEPWRYAFLIGKKGSEMRHIQNNYRVKVNIPREGDANPNVVIVGEEKDVERAIKYIEKVIYESAEPRGRGGADKAEDYWGDDGGEEEEWMSAYMYKRR